MILTNEKALSALIFSSFSSSASTRLRQLIEVPVNIPYFSRTGCCGKGFLVFHSTSTKYLSIAASFWVVPDTPTGLYRTSYLNIQGTI